LIKELSDPQGARRDAYNSLGKVMSELFHVAKRSLGYLFSVSRIDTCAGNEG